MEHEASRSLQEHPTQAEDLAASSGGNTGSNHSASVIPSFLENAKQQKRILEDELGATSGVQSSDIDEWISQAKKVQQDIARCKIEAAEIVKEHEQVKKLRASAHDAHSKVQLLQGEVAFTTTLQQELKGIDTVKRSLSEVEELLNAHKPIDATAKLSHVLAKTADLRSDNAVKILQNRQNQLKHDAHRMLEAELATQIILGRE